MSRINYADIVFENTQTEQYLYFYDSNYRYTYKQPLEINYSNGDYIIPPNCTDVPMNLTLETGYVAVYDPVSRTWNEAYNVWSKTYYYKETGELVINPDPNRLDEYTEAIKPFPSAIYNEELDRFIYPVNEYREILKQNIPTTIEMEANEDYILSTDGHRLAVSILLKNNLQQALLKLSFAVDSETGEPITSIDIDTYPVQQPESIGEIVTPDPRNEVITVDAEEIDNILTKLNEKITFYTERYNELSSEMDSLSDEEVNRIQIDEIKNSSN